VRQRSQLQQRRRERKGSSALSLPSSECVRTRRDLRKPSSRLCTIRKGQHDHERREEGDSLLDSSVKTLPPPFSDDNDPFLLKPDLRPGVVDEDVISPRPVRGTLSSGDDLSCVLSRARRVSNPANEGGCRREPLPGVAAGEETGDVFDARCRHDADLRSQVLRGDFGGGKRGRRGGADEAVEGEEGVETGR
jgi:hypothetical protein